ncbi:unnamed protein product, partial [Mesorhabditis belari]|uniref:TLC domain-containing protein n=1 Tax=Mesorhabditis belari TaxID=2138241 RepID=A0AAF3FGJ2_9BILA
MTWLFCVFVGVALRLEYLLAKHILESRFPEWTNNKRRIFAVRVVSCTHATISALGCICSLLFDLNLVREPYEYSNSSAAYIFLFSMGYFLYDLMDMYIHGELPNSKEYFVHHSLVLIAFSIILLSGRLFGFAMIGLLVEVQTIFLHVRTMVRLLGASREHKMYSHLINLNMWCLFVFRHLPITFLLYFLTVKDDKVPTVLRLFLVGGLTFLEYHNTHLTISMAKTDGFFGFPGVATLDEDSCDPLGAVNSEKEKAAKPANGHSITNGKAKRID